MNVLVINAGSSSLKYQLIDMSKNELLAKGLCERIGIDGKLNHSVPGREKYVADVAMPTHKEAIQAVISTLTSPELGVIQSMKEIDAVGHRVAHGGEFFADSAVVTPEVAKQTESLFPLAPLHNPANMTGYYACKEVMGEDVPQVLTFDTSFHQSMPQKAYMYAIPYEYYEKYKIRRYGFHGTSHKYVAGQAAQMLGRPIEELKIITCHLGNGSSITAVDGGKSVDTSMGFTPLDGLPMGTRTGSLDPTIIEFLCNELNISASEALVICNKKSGMQGISGVSSDFRDLEEGAKGGNARCQLALDMFVHAVKKTIGSYIAEMGGVDAIVFTAGVGENDIAIRSAICDNMDFFGIRIDEEKNQVRGEATDISAADAKVKTLIIPTNEELVIAQDTVRLVSGK